MPVTVYFTRSISIAGVLERRIRAARQSLDVALYRLSNQRLITALHAAFERGAVVRIVINSDGHLKERRATCRSLFALRIPFRISDGRRGPGSKMHHKFAILDRTTVMTGSYNWTEESEEANYENLVVLDDREVAAAYRKEFESLWAGGREPGRPGAHRRGPRRRET